jgi:hypothetical protein
MTYKQRFTLVRQSPHYGILMIAAIARYLIVAVYHTFTDAMIHLTDALVGPHAQREQALRYLQVCVDAPQ